MPRRQAQRQGAKELVDLWVDLFREHDLLTYASAIAFQALVAFVAVTLLGLAVLGDIGRTDVWDTKIGPQIQPKVLEPVFSGLDATAQKIFASSSTGLIVFAAILTVWEMSGVVRAIMGAIARIYDTEDDRSWKVRFPVSIGISFVLTTSIVGAILLAGAGGGAVHGSWSVPYGIVRWLLALFLIGLGFGLLVRYAPVEPRPTPWASGGATLLVVAWVIEALLFALYLRHVADYRTAAGSLLGIYLLTTFLYVAAIILLVGIEVNEQLRKDVEGEEDRGILRIVRDVL